MIYRIINKINNISYIGSSVELEKRCKRHIRELRKNKHHCIKLQRSFNKYGEENFIIEVLDELLDNENILKTEQDWIDLFLIDGLELYNSYLYVMGDRSYKHSEETKAKISLSLIGNQYRKGKASTQVVKDKQSKRMKGNKRRLGIKHSESTKQKMKDIRSKNPRKLSKEEITNIINRSNKQVYQIDKLNNNIIKKFNSIKDAANSVNISASLISNVIHNKRKTAGGYKWRLVNDSKC